MWSKLKGIRASSTRAELAAVVVAPTIPRAIEIASDSKAVVQKFMRLCGTARERVTEQKARWEIGSKPMKKPWGL